MSARLLVLLALLGTSARAEVVQYTTTIPALPSGGTASVTLPPFDSSLGVLAQVRLLVDADVNCTLGLENTANSPVTVGGSSGSVWLAAYVPWQYASWTATSSSAYAPPQSLLAAYDGVTDYAGSSGATYTTVGGEFDGSTGMLPFVNASAFDAFTAPSGVTISLGPVSWLTPSPTTLPPGLVLQGSAVSTLLTVRVEYSYAPNPATICPGHLGAAQCPCDNFGVSPGGCANSVNAAGGLLSSTGVPSISSPTLALHGSRMTNSNALYFQGSAFQYAQSVYGDGLRCVTGTVVRLGTRSNVGGASSVPAPNTPPLSTVGGIVAPGTRYYQAIYRDNGGFCTPSTFNATNGLAIAWTL